VQAAARPWIEDPPCDTGYLALGTPPASSTPISRPLPRSSRSATMSPRRGNGGFVARIARRRPPHDLADCAPIATSSPGSWAMLTALFLLDRSDLSGRPVPRGAPLLRGTPPGCQHPPGRRIDRSEEGFAFRGSQTDVLLARADLSEASACVLAQEAGARVSVSALPVELAWATLDRSARAVRVRRFPARGHRIVHRLIATSIAGHVGRGDPFSVEATGADRPPGRTATANRRI
jgi:hypothetical protein